jgi:hypothetical protein
MQVLHVWNLCRVSWSRTIRSDVRVLLEELYTVTRYYLVVLGCRSGGRTYLIDISYFVADISPLSLGTQVYLFITPTHLLRS